MEIGRHNTNLSLWWHRRKSQTMRRRSDRERKRFEKNYDCCKLVVLSFDKKDKAVSIVFCSCISCLQNNCKTISLTTLSPR